MNPVAVQTNRVNNLWTDHGNAIATIASTLQIPIEVIGNRAAMPYGQHMRVQFVREGADWKIEDPE